MSDLELTHTDYPLMAVGTAVYRRLENSPMFTVATPTLANDICRRLNETLEVPFDVPFMKVR